MLKWRLLTAFTLIAIVVGGIFTLSTAGFAVGCAVFTLLAGYEWCTLVKLNSTSAKTLFFSGLILGMLGLYFYPALLLPFLSISCILWLLNGCWVLAYQNGNRYWPKNPLALGLLGGVILLAMWAGFLYVRHLGEIRGPTLMLLCLLVVWGADTFAYFAGRRFGKRALISEVSPNKTWEGLWGALLGVMVGLIIIFSAFAHFKFYLGVPLSLLFYLLIFIFFVSVLGDLFESMVKRFEGVKDSGSLLPGHGGMLDRLDSLIAAMPFFALGCALLGTTA